MLQGGFYMKEAMPARILSIVIPALDEEKAIESVIKEIPSKELLAKGYTAEIIVVDNGSTDRTAELAKKAGARVIFHPEKGYGSALKKGLESAKGEIFATADADMTYPLNELLKMLSKINEGFDFVAAERFSRLKKNAMPLERVFGNTALTCIMNFMFGASLRDSMSGMVMFRKNSIALKKLCFKNAAFAAELKAEAISSNARFAEIAIEYRQREGKSKLSPLADGLSSAAAMLRKRLKI